MMDLKHFVSGVGRRGGRQEMKVTGGRDDGVARVGGATARKGRSAG